MVQYWTNGRYKSTEHRVFNSSASRSRYSVPFFCNCDFDALVEPHATGGGAGGVTQRGGGSSDGAGSDNGAAAGGASGSGGVAGGEQPASIQAGRYIMAKLGLMWDEPATASGSRV
jgi:hypothetical protein